MDTYVFLLAQFVSKGKPNNAQDFNVLTHSVVIFLENVQACFDTIKLLLQSWAVTVI